MECLINYESEVGEVLIYHLMSAYGVEDEKTLFDYFYFRFMIEHYNKKIDKWTRNRMLADFLLRELNLPLTVVYRGVSIHKNCRSENSLENIIVDWEFQSSLHGVTNAKGIHMTHHDFVNTEWRKIATYGRNKAKHYRRTKYYDAYFKLNALELLNKHYRANPSAPAKLPGFEYPENHNYFVRTLEERYSTEVHSAEFMRTDTETISESDLENYLITHLNEIEEGLVYEDRQCIIQSGRIDILARDKDREYVILELKVQEDKDLIWQSLYYPMQFKSERHVDFVRMITIAPDYPPHILKPLEQIGEVEIIKFTPVVELGKIQSISFRRIH